MEVRHLPVSIRAVPITDIFFLRHCATRNQKVAKDKCSLFPSLVMAILQNKTKKYLFFVFSIMFSAQEIIVL